MGRDRRGHEHQCLDRQAQVPGCEELASEEFAGLTPAVEPALVALKTVS